jgi:hypothetical protein
MAKTRKGLARMDDDRVEERTAVERLLRRLGIDVTTAEADAAEWMDAGFDDAEEVEEWMRAGCESAKIARRLEDAGITPEQAAMRTTAGDANYEDTIARKVTNGDLSIDEARRVITSSFWNS